jgi:fructan beta-fructosidase
VAIFCDASSIEIFVDDGRYVFTNQVFPEEPYNRLKIVSDGTITDKIIFSEFNSIWHEQ